MRTHVSRAARGLGNLVLSFGLLAGCATSPAAVAHGTPGAAVSDRVREEKACLRASVGQDDEGRDIIASPGRFGPYIKRVDDTRSLASEEQLLTINLEESLGLLAQPKRGRGRQAAEPLAELGPHPDSGATVKLLAGRYGPYVTDGTTNASLPKTADPAKLTMEEAVALLKAREEAGPSKKAAGRRGGAPRMRRKAS